MHSDLNLKSLHLGESRVSAHAVKSQAHAAAKKLGLSNSCVTRAANRFSRFWVLSQGIGAETLRLFRDDGTWLDVPHPGRW